MDPPQAIDPTRALAVTDPYALPLVEALHFQRPAYVKILGVLLVLLISVSGGIALLRRDVDDLLLGIGGLILGIWGRALGAGHPAVAGDHGDRSGAVLGHLVLAAGINGAPYPPLSSGQPLALAVLALTPPAEAGCASSDIAPPKLQPARAIL
jgi:hypothetical protein